MAVPIGATLQRIDIASIAGKDAALLRARLPGETVHLLLVSGRGGRSFAALATGGSAAASGVAIIPDSSRDAARAVFRANPPSPIQLAWRARLEGARVVRVSDREIKVECDGQRVVLSAHERLSLAVEADAAPEEADAEIDVSALEARGAQLIASLARASIEGAHAALLRALKTSISRLARREDAIRGDLARIGEAEVLAARARLFVAEASRAPRGARVLKVLDWSTGDAVEAELALDPARTARDQIDAVFKRARRLKEGGRIGREREAAAEGARTRLEAIAKEVGDAADLAALTALEARARAAAPRDFGGTANAQRGAAHAVAGRAGVPAPRSPFRAFFNASGARILVGRGAADNDALTFHVAKPHDLWLHAKGHAGAHVVVPLAKGKACPAELLVDAAHLAAHFSDARDEALVEVQHTPRRYLRKPRGSAPGLVVVDREKVLLLRKDDATLRRLLETEGR